MIPTEPVIDETGGPSPEDAGSNSDMMSVIPEKVIEAPPETASADRPLTAPVPVSKAALVFDASVDDAAKTTAKHGQLAAAGLVARETA